jgi:hypothetical protein
LPDPSSSKRSKSHVEVNYITPKIWMIVLAAVAVAAALLLFHSLGPLNTKENFLGSSGIPEDYYFTLKQADVDSPIELVRFASSIKPDTAGLDINEKVAYFEWYLKNRGFDVCFLYSDSFRGQGQPHVWLMVKNQQNESMYVEPSAAEMKADSICPTSPEYKAYQKRFKDIYELSGGTGGADEYAWWRTDSGRELFDKSVTLLKKNQL